MFVILYSKKKLIEIQIYVVFFTGNNQADTNS